MPIKFMVMMETMLLMAVLEMIILKVVMDWIL